MSRRPRATMSWTVSRCNGEQTAVVRAATEKAAKVAGEHVFAVRDAAGIRQALRAAFPRATFRVQAIQRPVWIEWFDGPLEGELRAATLAAGIARPFITFRRRSLRALQATVAQFTAVYGFDVPLHDNGEHGASVLHARQRDNIANTWLAGSTVGAWVLRVADGESVPAPERRDVLNWLASPNDALRLAGLRALTALPANELEVTPALDSHESSSRSA